MTGLNGLNGPAARTAAPEAACLAHPQVSCQDM